MAASNRLLRNTASPAAYRSFVTQIQARTQQSCRKHHFSAQNSNSGPSSIIYFPRTQSPPWSSSRGPIDGRRRFSASPAARHGHLDPPKPGEERKVTFTDKDGVSTTFEVADGDNLLDIAQANDIEMEGACGGSCACSTCHVIIEDEAFYNKMPEPEDDENDMLDLAFGLTETSRLGCQVKMTKELDGLVVRLPSMTRNLQASDFVEKDKNS